MGCANAAPARCGAGARKLQQILREAFPDDPKIVALTDAFEQVSGFIVRDSGLPELKPAPLHEAWGGKEPPEQP